MNIHEKYMKIALEQAKKAYDKGEIPIGCIIVKNGKILAKTHNLKETKRSSLFHAEILAILKCSKKMKNWRLLDCDMYVTMEPCPMCASAIKQSRIKNVYYGIDNKNNIISRKIFDNNDINESVNIHPNVLKEECYEIVKCFFENTRNR